ncbi:MAG: aspartate-semialdehyde dehydrogenase [Pseudomonas sp.]|nr:aspartate-semialdehyde dehydrogenase [Pseudomonas sp.]
MLPPMIPLSAAPVTSQLDPVKQRPDIAPVVPVQPPSNESTIDLRNRDPEQTSMMLREEQQRRQQEKRRQSERDPDEPLAIPGDSLNADNTVPVVALIDDEPRQGLWVDVEV